ncbi:alpha-2-macroglobulin family protein [Mucilaginibacter sp.]
MVLNPGLSKKLFFLLILILLSKLIHAQQYHTLTFRIDSLASAGLPKSALNEVTRLDQLARKRQDAPEIIRAVIYRTTFQSYLEENALAAIITTLNNDVKRSSYPVRPVLQSLLAEMYWKYYQQNRWQINQRTTLDKPDPDFTRWDLRTLIAETSRLYKSSLQEADHEQQTPLSILDGVLAGDQGTRYLRPTLYDLLVHRAFDFYLAEEPALPLPRLPFRLTDARLFGDSRAFVDLAITTTDTASTYYQGLRYLQQVTAFHLRQGHREAVADLDLKRLEFLQGKATLPGKDSLYLQALRQTEATFADKPLSADALVLIGRYHQRKDSLRTAMAYLRRAAARYPESLGGRNAAIAITEIEQQDLLVTLEGISPPGKPLLGLVAYKNLPAAGVQVFRLNKAQMDAYRKLLYDPYYNGYQRNPGKYPADSVLKYLKAFKPVQQQQLQLPGTADYRQHTTEFGLQPLPAGNYVLLITPRNPADSLQTKLVPFQVSRMAYMARRNPDSKLEIRVMDRETGEPLPKVGLKVSGQVNNWNKELRYVYKDTIASGLTNNDGVYRCRWTSNNQPSLEVALAGDTLLDEHRYLSGNTTDNEDDEPKKKTILFTDRQIYRPGQTIYFKGLQLSVLNGKSTLLPNDSVSVDFNDVNSKVIKSLDLVTNVFGTFAGSFAIPQHILNGEVTIETDDGEIRIKVEEYKRPTFKVEFAALKGRYPLDDSLHIKGKAMAFSGYGLSQARVAYHITRTLSWGYRYNMQTVYGSSYRYEPSAEIAADTISTDAQGNYTIAFKSIPGESLLPNAVYEYSISADVTDASGETQSGQISVKAGRQDLQIEASVPEYLFTNNLGQLPIKLTNLNRQPLKGNMRVKLNALQAPAQTFKQRLWGKPDQFMLSRETYLQQFPDYAYRNEDQYTTWQLKNTVIDVNNTVDTLKPATVDLKVLKNQPSGVYRLTLSGRTENGDTASIIQYVKLINKTSPVSDIKDWVIPVINAAKPGEQVEFLAGIIPQMHILVEHYQGTRLLHSGWITQGGQQRSIKLPVTQADPENTAAQFMMVFHNRVYTSYQPIYINHPERQLNLRLQSFRDLLQPGQKEQWKLQITNGKNEKPAAELLAGMYDATLDQITAPADWSNALNFGNRSPEYFRWDGPLTAQRTASTVYPGPYHYFVFDNRIYERLNLFGYNYYGGYNYAYREYLAAIKDQQKVRQEEAHREREIYKRNAALVKNGVEVTGRVVDINDKTGLPGVSVKIRGTAVSTSTNSSGYFKIKAPVNQVLVFGFIGYHYQEVTVTKAGAITIALKPDENSLNEVVVTGYATQHKRDLTGSVAQITLRGSRSLRTASAETLLQGVAAGVTVIQGAPGGNADLYIRGIANLGGATPLYVIDGVPTSSISQLKPSDIASISVLKGDQTAIYGAAGRNGVVVIITKNSSMAAGNNKPIATRKNFNETAFFFPQLHTDEKGGIAIDFTLPESLTRWRFKAFSHTRELATGYLEREVVTQKQLMISANMPRFMREGDTVEVSARVANLTAKALTGRIRLQLFNALTMQPVALLANPAQAEQMVALAPATNKAVSFRLIIPAGLDALTYRITAEAGDYTDGEENTLPVLPNRMLVTEAMPMMVRAGQTKTYTFDKLVQQRSTTLISKTLTLEYTQNPAWYAVQALPYLIEFPYECAEQTFSRYFANSLSAGIISHNPQIKKVFERWQADSSQALLSNLEKNPELKATLLEETPWLRDAAGEQEQRKRIALLFDLQKLSAGQEQTLDKLQQKQLPNGGFPWFGGDRADRYITQHIVAGIGQLNSLKLAGTQQQKLDAIGTKALGYLDAELLEDNRREMRNHPKTYKTAEPGATEVHAWYARSFFANAKLNSEVKALQQQYLNRAAKSWLTQSIYQQGMTSLTLLRYGRPEVARQIIRSLMERAQQSDDMGMYWSSNQLGWYWYESPVETQALMIALFTEAGNQPKAVEEMKIWLLRNKQTNNWRTTKATAEACYALLMRGDSLLSNAGSSVIKINNQPLSDLKPQLKAEAGTGYLKTSWAGEQILPAMDRVAISNQSKTVSWGALYWQYTEQLDKITPANTDIHLERRYFIVKQGNSGEVLTAVDAAHQPKTGDLLKVVVYLKAGRNYEYVQLKDMRPAGAEPVDVLSDYKYQDGLYYYQVTKDAATNFFISQLNKGNYVFEYRLRVAQPGNFSTGISTVQCMYAPEFNAHSEGQRIVIK